MTDFDFPLVSPCCEDTITHPKHLNPLTLAYIGDAVYEIYARLSVLSQGERPVKDLHRQTVSLVQAAAQSHALDQIQHLLTDDEIIIYKRGRNASPTSMAKTATSAQYHRATGLEALFGYLYLTKQSERIHTLFSAMHPCITKTEKEPIKP